MKEVLLRHAINNVILVGDIFDHNLEYKIKENEEYIIGSLRIKTREFIDPFFTYVKVYSEQKETFEILKNFIDKEYITIKDCKDNIKNITTKVKILLSLDELLYKEKDTGKVKVFKTYRFRNIMVDDFITENYKAKFDIEIFVHSVTKEKIRDQITGRAIIRGWIPIHNGITPIKVVAGITVNDEGNEFDFGEEIINNVKKGMTINVWGDLTENHVKSIEFIILGAEIQEDEYKEFNMELIKQALNIRKAKIKEIKINSKTKVDNVIKDIIEKIEDLKTMPYKEYLQSNHWKAMRKRQLKLANYKCGLCNSKDNLNVHHKTYENRGDEKDEDLIVLCQECHAKFHGKFVEECNNIKAGEQIIPIVTKGLIKTKLFISDINQYLEENILDAKINEYILKNNITSIINIQTNFNVNNMYSALLIYNT